jgi:hypothetical protein
VTSRVRRLAGPALLFVALTAVGCGTSQGSGNPTGTATDASSTPPAESAPASTPPERTAQPLGGQTDTDWGRIWDSLPSGFPTYPGSTPSEEAQTGPASAVYVVAEEDPTPIVARMQDALETAAYSTEALSGPMEDGSYVLESIGEDADCRVEVTVAPLGGMTSLTILYGAHCPHD